MTEIEKVRKRVENNSLSPIARARGRSSFFSFSVSLMAQRDSKTSLRLSDGSAAVPFETLKKKKKVGVDE